MKKTITLAQVANWVGSDFTREDSLKLLTEIANGEYAPEQFASDIIASIDATDVGDTNQVVWEQLNGALFDLTEGDPSDAIPAIEDCIARLETVREKQ